MKKRINIDLDLVLWKRAQYAALDDDLKLKNWIEKLIETTVNERSKTEDQIKQQSGKGKVSDIVGKMPDLKS